MVDFLRSLGVGVGLSLFGFGRVGASGMGWNAPKVGLDGMGKELLSLWRNCFLARGRDQVRDWRGGRKRAEHTRTRLHLFPPLSFSFPFSLSLLPSLLFFPRRQGSGHGTRQQLYGHTQSAEIAQQRGTHCSPLPTARLASPLLLRPLRLSLSLSFIHSGRMGSSAQGKAREDDKISSSSSSASNQSNSNLSGSDSLPSVPARVAEVVGWEECLILGGGG